MFLHSSTVIQEAPKSEKLYILDSIEVPVSELNKYKHLSVLNKLPDNIVLPPPPPLRHETNVPDVNANESMKSNEEDASNHVHAVKNDFEENIDCDISDLVETKNDPTIQNFKKLIKKYKNGKQLIRSKMKHSNGSQQNLQVPNEHSNDLSTPLRSLSPAHGFDEMASAVDLSVNSKEIDEFIDNLSICSDDNEPEYDLIAAEYLNLTEPQSQPIVAIDKNDVKPDDTNDDDVDSKVQSEKRDNLSEDIVLDDEEKDKKENAKNELDKIEHEKTDEELDQIDEKDAVPEIPIETLRNICIQTFNTTNFRSYFTENVINAPIQENAIPNSFSTSEVSVINGQVEDEVVADVDVDVDDTKKNDEDLASTSISNDNIETIESDSMTEQPDKEESSSVDQISISRVPTLRRLAMEKVLINQYNMSINLKPFKNVFELDSERKVNANSRVRTLQELAREVAVTIYSFNVKPLQELCRLALDKFNTYWTNRMEAVDANRISEIAASENINNLYEG